MVDGGRFIATGDGGGEQRDRQHGEALPSEPDAGQHEAAGDHQCDSGGLGL